MAKNPDGSDRGKGGLHEEDGIKFAKMSGRGLGHTGGTIDKLESIPGYTTSVDIQNFIQNIKEHEKEKTPEEIKEQINKNNAKTAYRISVLYLCIHLWYGDKNVYATCPTT